MPCARIIIRESPRARSLWVLAVVCVEEMIEDKVLTHTRARSPARDGRGRRVRPRPTLCLDLGIPTPPRRLRAKRRVERPIHRHCTEIEV